MLRDREGGGKGGRREISMLWGLEGKVTLHKQVEFLRLEYGRQEGWNLVKFWELVLESLKRPWSDRILKGIAVWDPEESVCWDRNSGPFEKAHGVMWNWPEEYKAAVSSSPLRPEQGPKAAVSVMKEQGWEWGEGLHLTAQCKPQCSYLISSGEQDLKMDW